MEVSRLARDRPSEEVRSKSTDPDKRLALCNRYTACAEPVDVCPTKTSRYLVVVESCGKHLLCLTLFDYGEAEAKKAKISKQKEAGERRKELDKRLSVLAARIV